MDMGDACSTVLFYHPRVEETREVVCNWRFALFRRTGVKWKEEGF
jgi:hypothetical protein